MQALATQPPVQDSAVTSCRPRGKQALGHFGYDFAQVGHRVRVHGRILAAFGRRHGAPAERPQTSTNNAGHSHEIRPPGHCAPRHRVRAARCTPRTPGSPADEQILLKQVNTDKKAVYAANLGLTEEESAKFWPIYNEYEAKMKPLQDRFLANINTLRREVRHA